MLGWIPFSFSRVLCHSLAISNRKDYAKRFITKHYLLHSYSSGVSNTTNVDQCWDLFGELRAIPKHHCMHASIPPQKTLVCDGQWVNPKHRDSDRSSSVLVSTSLTPLLAALIWGREDHREIKQEWQSFSFQYLTSSSLRAQLEAMWTWQKHSHSSFEEGFENLGAWTSYWESNRS